MVVMLANGANDIVNVMFCLMGINQRVVIALEGGCNSSPCNGQGHGGQGQGRQSCQDSHVCQGQCAQYEDQGKAMHATVYATKMLRKPVGMLVPNRE